MNNQQGHQNRMEIDSDEEQNQNNPQIYYCHGCMRRARVDDNIQCLRCNGAFVELIENSNQDLLQPRTIFQQLAPNIQQAMNNNNNNNGQDTILEGGIEHIIVRDDEDDDDEEEGEEIEIGETELQSILDSAFDNINQMEDTEEAPPPQQQQRRHFRRRRRLPQQQQQGQGQGQSLNIIEALQQMITGQFGGQNMMNGQFGDYFLGDDLEALMPLLNQFDPKPVGQPPASDEAIKSIHKVTASKAWMEENDTKECVVCFEDFEEDEQLCQLPECKHTFHEGCILPWLAEHNSCPICRKPLDDPKKKEQEALHQRLSQERAENNRREHMERVQEQRRQQRVQRQQLFQQHQQQPLISFSMGGGNESPNTHPFFNMLFNQHPRNNRNNNNSNNNNNNNNQGPSYFG